MVKNYRYICHNWLEVFLEKHSYYLFSATLFLSELWSHCRQNSKHIRNEFSVHLIFLLEKLDNCIVIFLAKKSRPVNKKFFKNVFRILDRKVAENFVKMKEEISCETTDA